MNEPPIVRPVLQPTHDLLQQLADEQRTTNQILQSMDITLGKLAHTNSQSPTALVHETHETNQLLTQLFEELKYARSHISMIYGYVLMGFWLAVIVLAILMVNHAGTQ